MSTEAKKRRGSIAATTDTSAAAMSNPTKKRAKQCATQAAAPTAANTTTILDPALLNLALAWLDPKDVARSSQVCQQWKKGIAQHTWKQAAQNIKPEAFQALTSALEKDGKQDMMDCKTLATGLMHNHKSPPEPVPDPTLQAENLFLLVELEVCGQKRSWCKSIRASAKDFRRGCVVTVDYMGDNDSGPSLGGDFYLPPDAKGDPPWHREFQLRGDPGAHILFANTEMTLSLWRADTGQCVCFLGQIGDNYPLDYEDRTVGYYYVSSQTFPVGKVAVYHCFDSDYNYLQPHVNVHLEPLPALRAAQSTTNSTEEDVSANEGATMLSCIFSECRYVVFRWR